MRFFESLGFGGGKEKGTDGAGHVAVPDRGMDESTDQITEEQIRNLKVELAELREKGDQKTGGDNDRIKFIENRLYNAGVSTE